MEKERGTLQFSQSLRIIIFILLFLVLIMVYSVVYQAVQRGVSLRREKIRECETAFQLMQEKLDEQLAHLLQISSVVHQDQYLRAVSREEYSVVDAIRGQSEIDKLMASNSLLNQVYYYVRKSRMLFGMTGVYPFPESEPFFTPMEGIDAQMMRDILGGGFDDEHFYLLPACRSTTTVENVIPVVMSVPFNSAEPYATILLEVREDKLLRLILPAGLGEDIIYDFYREDGVLLMTNSRCELTSLDRRTGEGLALYEADGQRYCLFESQAHGKAKLTYRMYVPESVVQAGSFTALQMRLMIAACVGMLLLLCPVLYFWTYQPMRMLIEHLLGTQNGKKRVVMQADYSIALREIEQLRASNNSLLWKIDSSMNLVRVSLLRHLIEYGRNSDDFLALCRHADLNFQHAHFRLLLMALPESAPQGDVSQYARFAGRARTYMWSRRRKFSTRW